MAKKVPNIVKRIREHSFDPINYSWQKNVSFSQMSMFMACPKKWSLQYKDGHKEFTSSIHTVFGTSLHEALQHYLNVMYNKSAAAADKEDIIGLFESSYRDEYMTQYKKNNSTHFSNSEEMREFFEDGVEIINFIKKNRGKYFSKRGWHLVGCEVPIIVNPNPHYKHIVYQGYLDVVMYHEPTNKFKIIDIKTSTKSWNDYKKKDKVIKAQLLLYKKYFSEIYDIPLDDIEIEFFIVKRKLNEWAIDNGYPSSRVQQFVPANGKTSINQSSKMLNDFIDKAFNKSGYKDVEHETNASKWNCKFCAFANSDLCKDAYKEK